MIGIDVEIELMEGGAYTNAVYSNGDYQMTVGSWSAMFLDAYSVMYSQFHKDCYGGNRQHHARHDRRAFPTCWMPPRR